MAYRVIADHIRTCTFALADGAIFANEGRGYVLRRVLRRAVRYARTLGIEEAFMYKLVDSVCLNMQSFYPYLEAKKDFIKTLIKKEEELFLATLTNGEKLLNEALAQVKDQTLAGETVFKLYDTYGFPKEITAEVCADRGIKCDLQGFEQCMAKQKEMARSSRNAQESMHNQAEDLLNFTAPFKFRGYEEDTCLATVSGIFKNGCALNELTDSGEIALSQTVFYAESGGQCADHGYLENADFRAEVLDVQKAPHGQFLHHVKVLKGKVKSDDMLTATIDRVRRQKIRANHSSLHLLQAALRQILGKHIAQAGSFVSDSYARFDFTHFAKITATDLAKIEALVNSWIMAEIPITTTVMKLEEAKKLPAIALFDEKYEDYVRVVEMGTVSLEFCGGTHAANTQDLGVFKINSEESIGSGIRRIECQTKYCAYANYAAQVEHLNAIAESLKVKAVAAIDAKLKALLNENTQLNLELKRAKEKLINLEATEVLEKAVIINGLKCLLLKLDHSEIKLKDYALTLRNKLGEGLVFIADIFDDKITFAAALSSSAIAKGYKAGEIIRLAAALSEGKGGGRADLAQGGGKNCGNIEIIFKALKEYLTNIPHA